MIQILFLKSLFFPQFLTMMKLLRDICLQRTVLTMLSHVLPGHKVVISSFVNKCIIILVSTSVMQVFW